MLEKGKMLETSLSIFFTRWFLSFQIKIQFPIYIYFVVFKCFQFEPILIFYNTIPTFNDPEKEAFWKYYGKRRKCW